MEKEEGSRKQEINDEQHDRQCQNEDDDRDATEFDVVLVKHTSALNFGGR